MVSVSLGTSTSYAYDASGQLVAANSLTYAYDGNRANPGDLTGPDNQILADGTWTYAYDPEGNRVGKTNIADGTSWAYTYDDANRLTSATESDAKGKPVFRVTYAYDVFGNRIEQAKGRQPFGYIY